MIGIRTSSARPTTRAVSLALAVGLIAAACGSETAKTDSSAAPPVPINTSQGPTVASPAATEPEATTPVINEPAGTEPIATDAPGIVLSSLEPEIRKAMSASLEPGFYTVSLVQMKRNDTLTGNKTYLDQDRLSERTTGFEPATLALARLWFPSAESVPVH